VSAKRSSWKELLANPGPNGHIVQLYQDADFYGEAISHFAAEGLVRGESIIIVATTSNWANISGRLVSKGFNPEELLRRGQLILLDAEETLPKFLVDGMPDAKVFKPLAKATIERARAGGRFPRVRWWGEMVNLLYVAGNQSGSTRLEEFFDEVAHEQSIAIFCSFLMDKYDPKIYNQAFGDVCRTHAHLIPAEDYAMHKTIVDRAIGDVIGPIQGPLLRSLVSWVHGRSPGMPASQSILLWVKDAVPMKFDEVLACARRYESDTLSASRS
jgi:MEDS: MEthanogen/methylotroph, DcmR Sensory domain